MFPGLVVGTPILQHELLVAQLDGKAALEGDVGDGPSGVVSPPQGVGDLGVADDGGVAELTSSAW